MATVTVAQVQTGLDSLMDALVSGAEPEITIERNGRPAVRMVAVEVQKPKRQLGLAAGKFAFDDKASDALDADIQKLFEESADPYGEKLGH